MSNGRVWAAANDTTPRIPAQEMATSDRRDPKLSCRWNSLITESVRKIQIGLIRITVASTTAEITSTGVRPMSGAVTMAHSCRPIRAKTAPSSTYWIAAQVARRVSRTSGCRS